MEESKLLKGISLIIGFCLLMILSILPFAFSIITIRYTVVLLIIAIIISAILLVKKDILLSEHGKLGIGIVVVFIFNLSNEANIIQKLDVEVQYTVPLATAFLSLGFLLFLVKTGIRMDIVFPDSLYFKYILLATLFLLVQMILLFPVFKLIYNLEIGSILEFLQNIFKIIFIIILVYDFLSFQRKTRMVFIILCSVIYLSAFMSLIL